MTSTSTPTGPICSPTRASFLTGRTPWRDCQFSVNYRTLAADLGQRPWPAPDHLTVGAAAVSKGYRAAHFGKWQ
jgi:arylsulfatase A-like enzyme